MITYYKQQPSHTSLTHFVKDLDSGEFFVKPIYVQPGESWIYGLPNKGRTVEQKMALVLSGDWEWVADGNVNHTTHPIRVFEGESAITGLPCLPFWEDHLQLATLTPLTDELRVAKIRSGIGV